MLRSISISCAGAPASAGSTSRPPPTSPRSPGCSRPTMTTTSGGCSPATSCPRRTCASAPSATVSPTTCGPAQGFIEATEGNVVDYAAIEQRIRADSALFQVREIAYDPWNATHIALRLQEEGAAMVEFRQGFRSMAAPTRELEKLIVSTQARPRRQPGDPLDGRQRRRGPGPRRQSQAGQGQIDRAHRRHRRPDHGDRPRHAAGRAATPLRVRGPRPLDPYEIRRKAGRRLSARGGARLVANRVEAIRVRQE